MSEISLRAYIDYIEGRLARDAFGEVVTQSRHILETYPKYVEVYKLLARAMVAQENYQDALDLFQRILSADPTDFVAHTGISECYKETGAYDQAIWHLERAFEQAPSDTYLQDAIKKLYYERDGVQPRKINLTSGALARLYSKGGLHAQATLEIEKAVRRDPNRIDLYILLANILWNAHKELEAGKVAAQILQKLPNSIDANAILAQIWLKSGQIQNALPFLQRLKSLDPYRGYRIEHRGEKAPADYFQLEMLDYQATQSKADFGSVDWAEQTGLLGVVEEETVLDEPELGTKDIMADAPDWLSAAVTTTITQVAKPPAGVPEDIDDQEPVEVSEDIPAPRLLEPTPDWLDEAIQTLPEEAAETSAAPPDAPSWLQEVLNEDTALPPIIEGLQVSDFSLDGEAPDWLQEIIGADDAPAIVASDDDIIPAIAPDDAPDWLNEVLSGAPTVEPVTGLEVDTSEPALPDSNWITESPAQPEELFAQSDVQAEEPPALPEATLPGSAPDAPDWLADILAEDSEPAPSETLDIFDEPGIKKEDTPVWLQGLVASADETGFTDVESTAPVIDEPSTPPPTRILSEDDEQETPSWLSDIIAGEEEIILEEEAPQEVSIDWLDSFLTEDPQPDSAPPEEAKQVIELDPTIAELEQAEALFKHPGILDSGELETWDAAVERTQALATTGISVEASKHKPADGAGVKPMPDWMGSADELMTAADDEDETGIPDWLSSENDNALEAQATPDSLGGDMPDWLKDFETGSASPTDDDESDTDMPDWLKDNLES